MKGFALFLVSATLSLTCPAFAADAAATSLPLREALYSVRVNGSLVSEGTTLLIADNGLLYVAITDLLRWRFAQPPSSATVLYHGDRYVALGSYQGLTTKVDSKSQELDITAAPGDFVVTTLHGRESELQPMSVAQAGAYANYALHGESATSGPALISGLFDFGVSERSGGAFTSSFLTQNAHAVRLETTWQSADPEKRRSIHVGDYVSQPGSLGTAFRFAGASIGTDFSTDPSFVTFPTASVRGLATLPSTIDVIVNSSQTASAALPVGPYEVGTIAGINGQNEAQVVVRDITGAEHTVTLNFYTSPTLLKRGLSDYSYQAGFERFNFGLQSWSYGPPFLQGTWRHGFSDRLTVEAHTEATSLFQVSGVAGTVLLSNAGTLNAGLAQSVGYAGYGRMAQLGYEYSDRRFSIFAQAQAADPSFRELGYDATTGWVTRLWQSGLSFDIRGGNQLSVASVDRQFSGGNAQKFLTVMLAHEIKRGRLQFGYATAANGLPATVTATMITSFASGATGSASSAIQHGKVSEDVGAQTGSSSSNGDAFNFRGHSGDSNSLFVQGVHQTRTTADSLALLELDNRVYLAGDVTGSFVFIGGKSLAARQVIGAYGLVSVPGYAGVGVLLNNQEIGKTDRNGDFVAPNLAPYNTSQISIDPTNLPISANMGTLNAVTVPTHSGAVLVRFETQNSGGVMIRVVGQGGVPFPGGTLITDSSTKSWPIAENGQAYLAGVGRGRQKLTVVRSQIPCEFLVTVPGDTTAVPDLGTFTCKENAEISRGA